MDKEELFAMAQAMDTEEYCMLESDTSRVVVVPDRYKTFGVEGDNRAERIKFKFPKVVGDNIDLSSLNLRINYQNAQGGLDKYIVETVLETDDDHVFFTWLIQDSVTPKSGPIYFVVQAVKVTSNGNIEKKWSTTLNKIGQVLEGLEVDETIEQQNPDIIESILTRLDELEENGGGTVDGDGGWSSTQIDLFEAFTNVIAYTSPDANSIVSSLISSLRSGSSDTPEGSFSIIYVLSNVTSSSKDNSIKSGEPYNTALTANPGYELESVIVKMGGSDITSTAYSDGEITISAVTGNIVITASAVQSSASGQLPQDGLVDYFDFRNKTYTAGIGGLYYINSDFGNGMLYSWGNQSSKQGDEIGIKGLGGSYTSVRATGYPVTDNFPSTRTVCMFGKGGPSVPTSIGIDGTFTNSFMYTIKYKSTDKSTKTLANEQIQYPEGFKKTGYNASFVIVNQNILKIYFDDKLHKTVDGSEIDDFESWDISPLALASFSNYGTAYAIYNKELSEVEIVEALEFFKTLEVSE